MCNIFDLIKNIQKFKLNFGEIFLKLTFATSIFSILLYYILPMFSYENYNFHYSCDFILENLDVYQLKNKQYYTNEKNFK